MRAFPLALASCNWDDDGDDTFGIDAGLLLPVQLVQLLIVVVVVVVQRQPYGWRPGLAAKRAVYTDSDTD